MKELDLITAAAALLQDGCLVKVLYITAEFSPISDKFRPDLVAFPTTRPNHAFFVEYRNHAAAFFNAPLEMQVALILEHRDFIDFDRPITLHYAFATDAPSIPALASVLQQQGITFFASVDTPERLASEITAWHCRT